MVGKSGEEKIGVEAERRLLSLYKNLSVEWFATRCPVSAGPRRDKIAPVIKRTANKTTQLDEWKEGETAGGRKSGDERSAGACERRRP